MSFRHPLRNTDRADSSRARATGKYLAVVPEWLFLQAMLATVAVGSLVVQMKLVSRLAASSRR